MASPLDLPRRPAASVNNSIDAAGELPVFQQKVLEHLGALWSSSAPRASWSER